MIRFPGGSAWLAVLTSHRGAWLWMPCILAAAGFGWFGVRMAPGGSSLFTRVTSTRIAWGIWGGSAADSEVGRRFRAALIQRLERSGTVSIADSARVALQLARRLDPSTDPRSMLRALRALNPHYLIAGNLEPDRGSVAVEIEAWDARSQQCVRRWRLAGASPVRLGQAAGDSVLTVSVGGPLPR